MLDEHRRVPRMVEDGHYYSPLVEPRERFLGGSSLWLRVREGAVWRR